MRLPSHFGLSILLRRVECAQVMIWIFGFHIRLLQESEGRMVQIFCDSFLRYWTTVVWKPPFYFSVLSSSPYPGSWIYPAFDGRDTLCICPRGSVESLVCPRRYHFSLSLTCRQLDVTTRNIVGVNVRRRPPACPAEYINPTRPASPSLLHPTQPPETIFW
jgi:hypothetical protein